MSPWIRTKDGLPPLYEEVILRYADGTILIGCRFRFGFLYEKPFGAVTHWMKIPEPPTK